MHRRTFLGQLTGGLLTVPLAGEAQPAGKVHRIGVLWVGPREAAAPFAGALDESLRQLGYVEVQAWPRAASYIDRLRNGAKPAELPVEQPTKFEPIINLKTAKALGLTIPRSLVLRAGEVLQ